jgi:large subunit ribosomal protein L25
MAETKLKAEPREGRGKGAARKMRATGRVPGVLYGHGQAPVSLSVSGQDLLHLFHASGGATMLVSLQLDGKAHLAIPREVQRDHIHARFIHVDFLAVRRDEKVTLSVEVHEVGEAAGVKAGGVIEHHLREVEVECLPSDVPEGIEAEVSELELGDMLRVRDLKPPHGVTILTDQDQPIVSVVTPAALRTEADLTLPGEEAPVPEEAEEVPEAAAEGAEAEAPSQEAGAGEGEG